MKVDLSSERQGVLRLVRLAPHFAQDDSSVLGSTKSLAGGLSCENLPLASVPHFDPVSILWDRDLANYARGFELEGEVGAG